MKDGSWIEKKKTCFVCKKEVDDLIGHLLFKHGIKELE